MASDEKERGSVHLLSGWAQYYPTPNNVIRVFDSEEEAERICEELNGESYEVLKERYDWLPEHREEFYEVHSYDVH